MTISRSSAGVAWIPGDVVPTLPPFGVCEQAAIPDARAAHPASTGRRQTFRGRTANALLSESLVTPLLHGASPLADVPEGRLEDSVLSEMCIQISDWTAPEVLGNLLSIRAFVRTVRHAAVRSQLRKSSRTPSHFHTNAPSRFTAVSSGVRFHRFDVAPRASGTAIQGEPPRTQRVGLDQHGSNPRQVFRLGCEAEAGNGY